METAEKMSSAQGFPIGIAEAIDLPGNNGHIKASPKFSWNRKEEPKISAHVEEEPNVIHVEQKQQPDSPPARAEEPVSSPEERPVAAHLGGRRIPRTFSSLNGKIGDIDTTTPIESVKEAVSRFGGSVDWKARRAQNFQKRSKSMGVELETSEEIAKLRRQDKYQIPEDLCSTNRLIEELKQNLENAEKEEHEAIEASEAARIKAEELEQEIENESMHAAALSDLNLTNEELKRLHDDYACLVIQKDVVVKMAEEAVAASKKIEQSLKYLTLELESLKLAQTAEGKGSCNWILELQHAHEKLQKVNHQALAMKDLKSKLDASSSLLLDLKSELTAYMESKLKQEDEESTKVLEEVKINIEKASAELDSVIATIRRSEETVSLAVATLKAELEMKTEIASAEIKKKGTIGMFGLDKKLDQASQMTDSAKSLAQAAEIELHEAKQEAEQAKARASAEESRLQAAQTKLDDAKYYEKLAIEAIKALQENASAENNDDIDSSSQMIVGLKEYYELRKHAYEAEQSVDSRVAAANSQVEMAKDSELNSLSKLEEANQELAARKKSLKMAIEKAEKAKEGKMGVEKELRKWKAVQEKKRNADKSDQNIVPSINAVTGSALETEKKKKKKKKFFRKIALFFSRRKSRRTKCFNL